MSVATVNVPRVLNFTEADVSLPPVWWRTEDGTVLIRCGGCGLPIGIAGWDIAQDGTVHPSIHHVLPPCGWHVFARLLDWEAPDATD